MPRYDVPCNETVSGSPEGGMAGFCECTKGVTTGHVPCKHPEFNCVDKCAAMLQIKERRPVRLARETIPL
jgi:hypothetical protein